MTTSPDTVSAGYAPTEVPAATRRRPSRRTVLIAVLAALACAALVAYAVLPWEWSFIDDGANLDRLAGAQARYGWLPGIAAGAWRSMRFDETWGLFRPAYWVFTATFYTLPVGVAHALRLAMLGAAVAGPIAVVARHTQGRRRIALSGLAGLAVLADPSLYMGLWYPSLQELSALSFVGLGLLVPRRRVPRILLFTIAAWFKAPFVWLLLAYGVALLLRRESRRPALLALGLGAATLIGIVSFAEGGFYEGSMHLTTDQVRNNLQPVPGLLGPALIVLVGGAIALGARIPALSRDSSALPLALLLGGTAYLANLLPWGLGTGSYYASAYVYLLTTGIVLLLCEGPVPGRLLLAGTLTGAVVWTGVTDLPMAHQGIATAENVNQLRDCVLGLPDGSTIGYDRVEGWYRLQQIVLRHDPAWRGHMYLVLPGTSKGAGSSAAADSVHPLDYYIEQRGYPQGDASLRTGPVVCRTSQSTVYKVVTPAG